jgi:hypothetical protein
MTSSNINNQYWIVDFNSKRILTSFMNNRGLTQSLIIGREFFVNNYPHFRNEAQYCSSDQLELSLLENEPNKVRIRLVKNPKCHYLLFSFVN